MSQQVAGQRSGTADPQPETEVPRPGAVRIGLAFTYLSVATMSWTGLGIGSISFGEVFLVLAIATLIAADLDRAALNLPPWVWGLTVSVLIVGMAAHFAPPSMPYLIERSAALNAPRVVTTATNLPVMFHLVLRIVLLPFMFGLARGFDRRALSRCATAFVVGSALSAYIAFTDSRGWTSIGTQITGVVIADHRGSGLTNHPNVVAMACIIAFPLAAYQATTTRGRRRAVAVIALIGALLGLYASRSRSGAGAAAVAAAVSIFWIPQYRRHLPAAGLAAGLGATVLFVANSDLGSELLSGLRLNGNDTTGSDRARSIVNDQGMRDFLHAPIRGIGLEAADVAHDLYLQALAVGGVILLAGLVIYLGGALVRSARLANVDPLALPLFVSVLGQAIFDALQNALTPTFAYLAPGLVAALPLAGARRGSEEAIS